MGTLRPHTVRKTYVIAAGVIVAATLLGFVLAAIAARGPAERVKRLLPAIGAERVQRALTGQEMTYALESERGTPITLADLPKDTVVFVNFWATWCKPCVEELPSMLRLRRELGDRRFIMVAISYDDDWAAIRDFFDRFLGGIPSPAELWILRDPAAGSDAADSDGAGSLRGLLGTSKLPDSYVVYNGRVLERFVNARDWTHPAILEYFRSRSPAR